MKATAKQRGISLVEMILTITILSIIVAGTSSAILLANRALPSASNPANETIVSSGIIEKFCGEIQYAIQVNASSNKMIEFTVADRDSNGVPETVRYEWSGVSNDPLTRQYNGGSLVTLTDQVQQFDLDYDLLTTSVETPVGNESAETLHDAYSSLQHLGSLDVESDRWVSQYIFPSLPADTLSWKVTRVKFYAKAEGSNDGECRVQLQQATLGNVPSSIVIEEKVLLESTLHPTNFEIQELTFNQASELPPSEGVCLVFKWITGTEACRLQYQDDYVPEADETLYRSADFGGTWTRYSDHSLLFEVYGTITATGEPSVKETKFLKGVTVTLKTESNNFPSVVSRVTALNQPEVMP